MAAGIASDATAHAVHVRICISDAAEVHVFVMSVMCVAKALPNGTLTPQYSQGDSADASRATAAATEPVCVPSGGPRTVTDVATIWRETAHN